jgi:hypothetical protein
MPAGSVIGEVLIDPDCACLAYACGGYYSGSEVKPNGVYESRDGGLTWTSITGPLAGNAVVTSMVIDPTSPSRLYLGTYGSGVIALFREPSNGGCSCP